MPCAHAGSWADMDRLAGKVALVTGAASGIGAAIVKRFLSEGAQVVATDVSDFPSPPSDGVVHLSQDTANENDWASIIMRVIADFGRLDILVNNAGVSARTCEPLTETTLDEWRRVLSINLDGVFLGMKHAMRAMGSKGGAIVNVGSVHSFVGIPNAAAYCASKGGLLMLTKAGALEGAALDPPIRVNSIHPGYVETPLLESRMSKQPERRKSVEAATPLSRLARPEEIASAVMTLVTDDAAYITGTALCVDGGYTAR